MIRKSLKYLLAAIVIGLIIVVILHAPVVGHWAYYYFGIDGHGTWYGFWSGAGSDFGELAILGAIIGAYRKHNCHVKGCWRLSKYQVKGTTHIVCRKHHPDDDLSHDDVIRDYKLSKQEGMHG